jgi:putative glutamine amidotransferase
MMRPVIAVTGGSALVPIPEGELDAHYVGRAYTRSIVAAGGAPVLLPAAQGLSADALEAALARVDGVVLGGGIDIDPSAYGAPWPAAQTPDPDRDRVERLVVEWALKHDLPLLGVCRGMQMINVALGGTLFEHVEHRDVPGVRESTFEGVRLHDIPLMPDSLVRRVLGRERVPVLCLHHQAPDVIGDGLRVGARSDDGIVEAIEATDDRFVLGVLWHPEHMESETELQGRLYEALVTAARKRLSAASPTNDYR